MKQRGASAQSVRRSARIGKAPSERPEPVPFPVVGIGASAGGLEAVTKLLYKLPPDTGMALVFVQHLDPRKDSILASLLSRSTSMPVHEVTRRMTVQPNHVYVISRDTKL